MMGSLPLLSNNHDGVLQYFCGHGSGNSFVVFDFLNNGLRYEDASASIHSALNGVGADSALVVEPQRFWEDGLCVRMRVIEQDGSESAFCGNGARLIASYLIPRYPGHTISMATQSGQCALMQVEDEYSVVIGEPEHVFDIHLNVAGERLTFAFIKVCEEPHLICSDFYDNGMLLSMGKYWNAHHGCFSEGINVSCLKMQGSDICLRTYERGVDRITQSCGSASLAAAFVESRCTANRIVKVRCAGGTNWVDTLVYALGGPASITSWGRLTADPGGEPC